jgi:hypothetical protein
MFKKLLFIFLLLIIISITAFGQDYCEVLPPPGSPGGDGCDDNVSFSNGNTIQYSFGNKYLIYMNGYFEEANKLFGGNYFEVTYSPEQLLKASPVLIFPTGGLFGMENDSTLKAILQEYVRLGGNVIFFANQYGSHIDKVVPVPEGQSLRSYGWREDGSCWANAINLKAMHPALAAMAAGGIVTDGQFSVYPSNSTILLRKGSNQEPVLLYYPYGSGTVILTSMYTDWGAAHSQATASELRLVRDLVTFAKNCNLAIPMYDLAVNPTPNISLQVKVKNDSENAATKAKMTVYTPDRKTVLYQIESAVSLAAGAETEIPLAFTLPVLTDVNLGICHTDYELYDAENKVVQMTSEADSGRFTPYRLKLSPTPIKDLVCWLTTENEFVYWDEKPQFILHVRNNTDHAITESFNYEWWHGVRTPLTTLTVAAGQLYEYHFEVPLLTSIRNSSVYMESFFVHKTSDYSWQTYKGIRVVYPSFSSRIQTPSSQIRFGDAINYTINSTNITGKAIAGSVVVKLLKDEQEIETLYSASHDFGKDENFNYSGSHTLVNPLAPGNYNLKLAVTGPDNKTFYSYKSFSYVRSNVNINLATIPEVYTIDKYNNRYGMIPGQTYSVNFKLRNNSLFAINQGRYMVTLKSESGSEVFRKEATNIVFNASQELAFSEPFVFSPVAGGKYILQVEYTDESRTAELVTVSRMQYEYLMKALLTSDKTNYHYLDTANIQLKIAGVGAIHIKCNYSNGVQERDIDIPVGQNGATEIFQVPIPLWFNSYYSVSAMITDASGNYVNAGTTFQITPPKVAHSAKTDVLGLKEGTPLNLTLAFSEQSGMPVPFNAVLEVQSPSLNYSDSKTVIIQPVVANEFNYQIPVAETVNAGLHYINYQLKIGELLIMQGSTAIELPAIALRFSEPPATINAGAAFDLQMENSGGRPGTFAA